MNQQRRLPIILLFSLLSFYGFAQSQSPTLQLKVDWAKFLGQHNYVINHIPEDYYEGPFVGNGLMGAILFKDDKVANTLRFEIGRTDVYDHRGKNIQSTNAFGRLPIGQLLLTPTGNIQSAHFTTDIWNAEINGEMVTTQGSIRVHCFVPTVDTLIIIQSSTTAGEKNALIRFRPEQGNHPRPTVQPTRDKGVYLPNPPFVVDTIGGIEVVTQPLLVGDDYATAWKAIPTSDTTQTIILTIANNWAKDLQPAKGSAKTAVATIKAALHKDVAAMQAKNRKWWHDYYPVSFVSLPDKRLEGFYWMQLYKLASATRKNCPVVDLMGPWFRPSVWAAYWTNLNIQLAYYTLGTTNHLDIAEALYSLIEKQQQQLIDNVPPSFRNDCAALGNPVGYGVLNAPITISDNNKTPMHLIALPWLMQLFYVHNQMEMNEDRLRNSIYPLMKRTFAVYTRTLQLEADGKYHIPYTYSDEYGNANETSLNIALAKWGYKTLIKCAEHLNIDEPLLPKWKNILANISDYPVDSTGIMLGKDVPFAKPHRHYSHLFGIFPLYELNIEDAPEKRALMEHSIEHFTSFQGDDCMFKFNGASSLWAALGNGDSALKWLNRSLLILSPRKAPSLTPNTLYSENGWPTFESPIASSRSELDMLLQSWDGKIRVFPACPKEWADASFYQLRCEGGFLVSAERKGGATRFIHIKSLAGSPCMIKADFKQPVHVLGSKTLKLTRRKEWLELNLKKGEEAVLYTDGEGKHFEIGPVGGE